MILMTILIILTVYHFSEVMIIVIMTTIAANNTHARWIEHRRSHNKQNHNSSQCTGIPP